MALKRLNTEHMTAIQYLALPHKGGKTDAEIAELCGVTRQTIYNWKQDPTFNAELKRQIVRNTAERLPELVDSMIEVAIAEGNASMAKLILTMNEMLTQHVEVKTTGDSEAPNLDDIKARLAKLKEEQDRG